VQALRQAETGATPVVQICRKLGVTETTFYRCKQYGGLDTHELHEPKQLREENRKLKQVVADLALDNVILKDAVAKNLQAQHSGGRW
jgi:putative transposase